VSKHAQPRPRWFAQLNVLASFGVVITFVLLFVGGATGMIGSPTEDETGGDAVSVGSSTESDDQGDDEGDDEPASESGASEPAAAQEPGEAAPDLPQPVVMQAGKLKRTLEWLRRGLADETTFRVGTFNVLGHSHTAPGGNRKGFASGVARMGMAYSLISNADLDLIGFQEFEDPQYSRFRALAGSRWDVYPGPTLDRGSIRNSLAWRTDVWELVEATSVGIPYFGGQSIRRPLVKLKNVESGREIWFFNTHNPADVRGNQARFRATAISIQTSLANELGADGTPVILTGDFNDRAEAFCPLVGNTELEAANGGSNDGSCIVPDRPQVDWIFGSGIDFSGYVLAEQGVKGRISDHPFVYAEGFIPREPLTKAMRKQRERAG
jgi:hypothetical protein